MICFGHIKNCMESGPISELYEYYSVIVPKIMSGDMKLMDRVIKDHSTGVKELCCLRSRSVYINASYHKISVNDYYSASNNVCLIKQILLWNLFMKLLFTNEYSWHYTTFPRKSPKSQKKENNQKPLTTPNLEKFKSIILKYSAKFL